MTEASPDPFGRHDDSAPLPDPALLWPDGKPTMLGRYQVLYRLGHGSHGFVYAGHDTERDRFVALKVFSEDRPEHEVQREAAAMSRSRHVNVVALHDVDRFYCLGFLVMDLIHGPNMWKYMCSRGNRWRRTVLLFIQAARGLAAVHRAGFAHGDVKPCNLLIGRDDHVYVADFSVARALDRKLAVVTHSRAGSHQYQAPERLRGAPADERADQYSLCVSLWQAVFFSRPWTTNEAEIIDSHAPAKWRRRIGIPRQLEHVLLRGLAVDPVHRFESMTALADALVRVVTPAGRLDIRRREAIVGGLASLAAAGVARFAGRVTPEPRTNMRDNNDDRRDEVCAEFGLVIRRLRMDRGLTRERLAERSDLAADTIRRLEWGWFSPSLHTMRKLGLGLGMRLSEIFDEYEDGRTPANHPRPGG